MRTQYIKRRSHNEYIERKVKKAYGFNLRRKFPFACLRPPFPTLGTIWTCICSLSPRVLGMNPRSNQKSSIWSADALKRTRDLDELLARARDTVIRYWLANTLSLQLSINQNLECPISRPMVIVLLSYSCCGVRTYVRTVT